MGRGSLHLQRAQQPKDLGCHSHGSQPTVSAQDCHSLAPLAQGAFSMAPGTFFEAPSLPTLAHPGPTGQHKKREPLSTGRQGKIMACQF